MAESILNQPQFQNADKAREYLEAIRWANGITCPHCGSVNAHYHLQGKAHRPGLYKCRDCSDQFTVTVGTVFERSRVGLHLWLQAVHLMCASKKGISAKQIERMLGVTYKTAWFMCHRIRLAMTTNPSSMLGGPNTSGIVEADETYWGRQKTYAGKPVQKGQAGFQHKMKILSLVERSGAKRTYHVANVNSATLGPIMRAQIAEQARLMTDDASFSQSIGAQFDSHPTVTPSHQEHARSDVTPNT